MAESKHHLYFHRSWVAQVLTSHHPATTQRQSRHPQREPDRATPLARPLRHRLVVREARSRIRSLLASSPQYEDGRPASHASGKEAQQDSRSDNAALGFAEGFRDFAEERYEVED